VTEKLNDWIFRLLREFSSEKRLEEAWEFRVLPIAGREKPNFLGPITRSANKFIKGRSGRIHKGDSISGENFSESSGSEIDFFIRW